MDDHICSFAMHRRMTHRGSDTVSDDAVFEDAVFDAMDGRHSVTADELVGRDRPGTNSITLIQSS